jgi:glycine oxidase
MSGTRRAQDVVIIGGGIIGCALAWELSNRGAQCRVLERRELAREASWASAGIISPPGPRHGIRGDLAVRAFRRYPSLIAEVEAIAGMSVGYTASGEVDLATAESASALRAVMDWQQQHGMRVEWLDTQALREREPAVRDEYVAGLYCADAGSVVLARMTHALARAAQARGATIVEHTPVSAVVVERDRAVGVRTYDETIPAAAVVVAAGAWSRTLADSLDMPIPTVPVRGQMMAIADPPIPIRSVISGAGGYLVPRADGTVAVGATEEHEAGFDARVTPAGMRWLADLVDAVAPSLLDGRVVATWAGLRPGTEDGEPIIGRAPHLSNVWLATGHFRSGALLAPSTAELLAASILSGNDDPALAPFDPARLI